MLKKVRGPLSFLGATLIAITMSSCGSDNPVKPKPNQPPDTEIATSFDNLGMVLYEVSGTDTDGSVNGISTSTNSGTIENHSNGSTITVPIKQGTNTITATSCDDDGATDPTPATASFISPTESQARAKIETILNRNSIGYTKDARISGGTSGDYEVDYLIITSNGDRIINYIGYNDDCGTEIANQGTLNSMGIPTLCLARLPLSDLEIELQGFIDMHF